MDFSRTLCYQFPLIRGEDVRAVQQALTALQVTPPCGTADGVYGDMSAKSVEGFQRQHNLKTSAAGSAPLEVNGEVDETTWAALFNEALAAQAPAARIQAAGSALYKPASSSDPGPCLKPAQVQAVRDWMSEHFGNDINAVVPGAGFDADLVYAIACQETAIYWLSWVKDNMPPDQVLARCVFDSSGDAPPGSRQAFPVNTAAFRAKYGDALTEQLIAEANATRALRHYGPAQWVYKGYGIFQYDLQNILNDAPFFSQMQWHQFRPCLDRLVEEMHQKLTQANNDLRGAVRRYNGAGPAAELYAAHVMQMKEWCRAA